MTLTNHGDGSYTLTGDYQSWTTFDAYQTLEAGEYSIEASEGLTSFDSWDVLLQVGVLGADTQIKPGVPSIHLDAGRYRCQININSLLDGPRTIRPVLNRIP